MSKDLWKGRFEGALDPRVRDFTASLELDKRLAAHDVRGSIAHARMLGRQGVIAKDEAATLVRELERIASEIAGGTFAWPAEAEDVHSAVERVLTERAGPVGGKLHTGRSRNDQIALDLRLLVVEMLDDLDGALRGLAQALVDRAAPEVDTVMPGYTHLQRAQPVSLAHHLLAHVEALRRDRVRANEALERAGVSPLGAGALAGVPYPIEPRAVAQELSLPRTFRNSIDAVSDRDFVADFTYVCSLAAVHASRLAEELVLWTSAEFGFAEFSDAHATCLLYTSDAADDLVRLAERHAPAREVIGEIGRGQHAALSRPSHRLAVEAHAAHDERKRLERRDDGGRVIERHAVLLQVTVVRERQTL